MPAIGEVMNVQEVPRTPDLALVTNKLETDIVREYTFEELLLSRQLRPETLGPFADLSTDELHHELDAYDHFLVQVGNGHYRLVIGYAGDDHQPTKGPTLLYAVSPPNGSADRKPRRWAI
jgi:hypothetical protein